jgi:CRP/FNR family transcriptional regulator
MTCDLSRCFLCTHCLPEWKEIIGLRKQTHAYKKGQPIFTEGDPVEGIFFVYEGSVKVHQQWGTDKELILKFAHTGDVLGYRGQAGTGGPGVYPVTATSLEATTACYIPQSFLEATFAANPRFLYRMMQLYADALRNAERRMRHLALTEVRGRIADAVLTIQETFGVDTGGYVKVPITRQDIASYAGTTYETVFKFFTEWTTQGLLDTSGKYLRVLDENALRAIIPR